MASNITLFPGLEVVEPEKSDAYLRPGSVDAYDAGCRCPIQLNNLGAGFNGNPGLFVVSVTCVLHGINKEKK